MPAFSGARRSVRLRRRLPLKVIAEGDSITANGVGYAAHWNGANPTVPFQNFAVSGAVLGSSADEGGGGNSLWARLASVIAAGPSILTVLIGANDLPIVPSTDVWMTNYQEYVAAAKSRLPGLLVLVSTVLPGTATNQNARRAVVNPLIRAGAGVWHDGVIPMGDDPVTMTDADASDPTLFSTGLHPIGNAVTRMGMIYTAVINPVVAGTTGNTPAPFTFTDVNNVPLSSRQTAETIVTGMGPAAVAVASVSGAGDFALGLGAFGTSNQNAMNGDVLTVEETASASNNTATSTTLTIGSRSDTFTATTVASNPITFASVATPLTDTRTSGPAAHSISWTPPAADGMLLYITKNGTAPTGVTTDDGSGPVAATKVGEVGLDSIWLTGPVSNVPHTLTISAATNNVVTVYTGKVTGASATTSSAFLPSASKNAGTYPATGGTLPQTVPTNGLMVIFQGDSTAGVTVTFANATLERDFGDQHRVFTSTTSMTPALTLSAFANAVRFIAVTLQP